MWFHPKKILLSSGSGIGHSPLTAFDAALECAGLIDFNLISLSSIVPKGTPVSLRKNGASSFEGNGRLLPAVYCHIEADSAGTLLSAAVGVGLPANKGKSVGVVFRYAGEGSRNFAAIKVKSMIAESFLRRKVPEFTTRVTSVDCRVSKGWTSVVACASYCDADLLMFLDR